jgi:DNA-damage-inducible protein D
MLEKRGVRPEALPPAEDVSKVKKRLATEEKKALKNEPEGDETNQP